MVSSRQTVRGPLASGVSTTTTKIGEMYLIQQGRIEVSSLNSSSSRSTKLVDEFLPHGSSSYPLNVRQTDYSLRCQQRVAGQI